MRLRNLLLPALSACLATAASPEILERVVAKVNGDIVTLSEFQARQVAAVQAAGNLNTDDRIERFLRENNARILQEAIDDLLLVQQAQELGMRMRPDYIKDIIDGIKKENNITSDDELQQQLRREGMSIDDLKRNIERSIMRRQLLSHELESKIAVTDDEVRADYEAHRADYDRPGSLHLQEIVVKTESGSTTLAKDLVRRARAGEDFAELARAYSAAPTRAAGGDLGRVSRGDLTPDIEKAALALPVGGVSEPLPTPEGFRILKLVEKTEPSQVPFDDVKAEIQKRLASERTEREYEAYMEGLRKAAIIDIRVREVPLQATVPSAPGLEMPGSGAPGGPPGAAAPADAVPAGAVPADAPPAAAPEAEISTTPQARPEHVVPEPAPSPTPPPR
jgi:peptidyl-prolyl cis-trans isomerase SurA